MACNVENLAQRLERIKKQNAEIRMRHLEVEADKKMAERSRALVHNHVTTNINDMMPAERDAILNRNEQILARPASGESKIEIHNRKKDVYPSSIMKSKNSNEYKTSKHTKNSASQRMEKISKMQRKVMLDKEKLIVSSNKLKNLQKKLSEEDDDDESDLFLDVQDLESCDNMVPDQVTLTGIMRELSSHSGPPVVHFSGATQVPQSQQRLENAVQASSAPNLQFLPFMDFSVPPPPINKEMAKHITVHPPASIATSMQSSNNCNDTATYVPYAPLDEPNMLHQAFVRTPLPSEGAYYPRSANHSSNRSSPPSGLLPPSMSFNKHNFSDIQQNFSNPNEVLAQNEQDYCDDYCNELPSIELLEEALHAMGANAQVTEPQQKDYVANNFQNCQGNYDNTSHHSQESLLNICGVEIPKEVTTDLLKKALAVVNNGSNDNGDQSLNSDSKLNAQGMKVLQLILSSHQNPNNSLGMNSNGLSSPSIPGNGRPLLGRGASDQNVRGIEQANQRSQSYSEEGIDSGSRSFQASYKNAVEDKNISPNSSNQLKESSYKPENYGYRPILGRHAPDLKNQEKNNQPESSSMQKPQTQSRSSSKSNNTSSSKKQSGLLARMEAARNDGSQKYSRSRIMSQQKTGDIQISYQGRIIQSIEPIADVNLSNSLKKEEERLKEQEDRVKNLVAKKTQLEEALNSTKEENLKIEETLKSLSVQKIQ